MLPIASYTQNLQVASGVGAKLSVTLGNQNQFIDASILGIAALTYGDAAMETGLSFSAGRLFKRHTVKKQGWFYNYDFFTLLGVGDNSNLLGAAFFDYQNHVIFNPNGNSGFAGLGFGFQKELLPKELSTFNLRNGKFLVRFSKENYSVDIRFLNDFRFGNIFYGQATDSGKTGSFQVGFIGIHSKTEVWRTGLGIALFTPRADHSKTPNNPINSDDGRKNVWHVQEPFNKTFYTNLYVLGGYQNDYFSTAVKLGLNSEKLGAFVQNSLHDSFGLNPRFPWNVSAKDKGFYEVNASVINNYTHEN